MFKERIKTHHSAMSTGKKYMLGMSSANQVLAEENQSARKDATIYIHVPFCNKICSFCNMQRSLSKPSERMFLHIANRMKQEGYHFLELTKMVKKDQYRYIMNRHRGADTLPLGAGAGGSSAMI